MNPITEEALCDVQAQLYALRIVVRAIVRTHPDPAALLSAWRDAVAEAATSNPVAPAGWRSSDYLAERMRAGMEDWTAELIELAVPLSDDPAVDPDLTATGTTRAGHSRPHQDLAAERGLSLPRPWPQSATPHPPVPPGATDPSGP